MSDQRNLSDLHMLLHWVGEHSSGGTIPERAAREMGIDLAVAERLFAELGEPASSRASAVDDAAASSAQRRHTAAVPESNSLSAPG
jgi:hypothetical protein